MLWERWLLSALRMPNTRMVSPVELDCFADEGVGWADFEAFGTPTEFLAGGGVAFAN